MPEFTVVMQDDGSWDIFLDGERCYFGLSDSDLLTFAKDFKSSNQNDNNEPWTETERAAYNGLSSVDYHNPL